MRALVRLAAAAAALAVVAVAARAAWARWAQGPHRSTPGAPVAHPPAGPRPADDEGPSTDDYRRM